MKQAVKPSAVERIYGTCYNLCAIIYQSVYVARGEHIVRVSRYFAVSACDIACCDYEGDAYCHDGYRKTLTVKTRLRIVHASAGADARGSELITIAQSFYFTCSESVYGNHSVGVLTLYDCFDYLKRFYARYALNFRRD